MTSDIKLSEDSVIVEGALAIGTDTPKRPLHVETGEIHSGGAFGGFSFSNRDAGAASLFPQGLGERWVLYSQGATARLWTSGRGDAFSVSTGGDIQTSGSEAGYSFTDRDAAEVVASPQNGERWVWYASEGEARLWSGSDKLRVTAAGEIKVGGGLNTTTIEGGKITITESRLTKLPRGRGGPTIPKQLLITTSIDVGDAIGDLRATVKQLEEQIAELKAKLG
jgi:hypothetical protein